MTPHYTDDWLTLYGGDCREVLASLPADSVDCVVTSPPYWGLRDYGTATWDGGDAECDHRNETPIAEDRTSTLGVPSDGGARRIGANNSTRQVNGVYKDTCGKCGAVRIDSQLGLERTPEEYVANMVAVFREVRRVLKPSGTCWLNLGDSYAAGTKGINNNGQGASTIGYRADGSYSLGPDGSPYLNENAQRQQTGHKADHGLKPKDLVGIPWRVAFALQADGWYLRSDIIWSKPNPMPESVTDRPTKSHEYLFLLTKSGRYYFDADAVREENSGPPPWGARRNTAKSVHEFGSSSVARPRERQELAYAGRNIRSVWNIATRPYPGAHFAVFPPELPERCIKAGSSEKGVCLECGAPWERVVERTNPRLTDAEYVAREATPKMATAPDSVMRNDYGTTATGLAKPGWRKLPAPENRATGWRLACTHDAKPEPAVVLDPFAGSGTVGMVANRLSRRAILIDLNPEYLKQQMKRNAQTPLGLPA